ncbi:MAG: diphthine synthase [archaeon]|jgi:diphthine synthase
MLYLIGIGLKPSHLTLEALECIKKSDQAFLEVYTSQYSEGLLKELRDLTGKDIKEINRTDVEENFTSALTSANKNNICLLVFGNPLTATTHIQLLLDAKEAGIKYKVIPGISITNMIAESGLDEYKFGRTVTICYHLPNFEPDSFYTQIKENQKMGLHTLCLLDIKKDQPQQRLMNSVEAIEVLEKIMLKKKQKDKFLYIALLGMGSEKQKILVGRKMIFTSKEIHEVYPQSMIIPGKMNEKEKEIVKKLYDPLIEWKD